DRQSRIRGEGPTQLPSHGRDLAAAATVSRGGGEGPRPARIPGGHRATDWRRPEPRRCHSLDGPTAVERHAAGTACPRHPRRHPGPHRLEPPRAGPPPPPPPP